MRMEVKGEEIIIKKKRIPMLEVENRGGKFYLLILTLLQVQNMTGKD